jgi:hypothetical protein
MRTRRDRLLIEPVAHVAAVAIGRQRIRRYQTSFKNCQVLLLFFFSGMFLVLVLGLFRVDLEDDLPDFLLLESDGQKASIPGLGRGESGLHAGGPKPLEWQERWACCATSLNRILVCNNQISFL